MKNNKKESVSTDSTAFPPTVSYVSRGQDQTNNLSWNHIIRIL